MTQTGRSVPSIECWHDRSAISNMPHGRSGPPFDDLERFKDVNTTSYRPKGLSLHTKASIAADLGHLGVSGGQLLMVHSSRKRIGYVLGGAQTVVRALIELLGHDGTLVMPAFSPEVSDPAAWGDHPIGNDALEVARDHVPAFDPAVTPTSMGAIAEAFRNWPDVLRSAHPQVSVTARGPLAERI